MKKLYKKKDGRKICGVCNGIADYLSIDVTILRIIWAVLACFGVGIIAYFICALIMSEEPKENVKEFKSEATMKKLYKKKDGRKVCGVCNGIADYLSIDVTILRVIWVVLACFGVGIIAYFLCALIMPQAPQCNVNGFKSEDEI